MKRTLAIIVCLLVLLSDQAKATVVFTDSFTAGADINLDAYPSGSPDWAMNLGASGDWRVISALGTVQSQVATESVARIIDAAVPTGDQEITATLHGNCSLATRCNTSGTANCYVAFFANGAPGSVQIYRLDNSSFTLLAESTPTFTNDFTARFRATGSGATINLEAQAAATTTLTYADSNAARKTSGAPGIHNGGNDGCGIDDVSVDNLTAASVPVNVSIFGRRRH